MLKRKGLLICAIVLILSTFAVPAFGADNISLNASLDEIVSYYMYNKTAPDNWEEVVGLAKAGEDPSAAPWVLPEWGIDSLQSSSSAKYATTILGMLAANQDPANVEGRNLVEELVGRQIDSGALGEQITDTIWAMIALDAAHGNYDIDKAANYLIDQKTADGGFALSGETADPDITGFALIALAPHNGIQGVSDAISASKLSLQNIQLDNGGFTSWGTENTETIATVVRGLVACGEDITADPWVKNGKTMIDALYAFQLPDKSFSHTMGGSHNDMATRQALMAVADMVNANIDYQIGPGDQSGGKTSEEATVRVRVEGAQNSLADETVTLIGTALDALKLAVGQDNVVGDSFVSQIFEEESYTRIAEKTVTNWMYYVIRDGVIDNAVFSESAGDYQLKDGDEIIFYNGVFYGTGWEPKTHLPVVSVSPQAPSAGQSVTISITAKKFDMWNNALVDLSQEESDDIGDYTLIAGENKYTSCFGQVTIHNVLQGKLDFTISNSNDAGYAEVVTYKGNIEVGAATDCQVRVRVEGALANLADKVVTVKGTALDALEAAAGESNVQLDQYGMVGSILGESGQKSVTEGTDTSWMYYVIRDGAIDLAAFSQGSDSYNLKNGDQIVFYIGAYDNATWDAKTYFPVVNVSPSQPMAGQSLVLNITAMKNNWGSLQDVTEETKTAIGDYIVKAGANEYLSSNGTVTIPNRSQGLLPYTISNPNESGYPDVITYTGSIEVKGSAGGGSSVDNSITVSIAIVGKDGNLLYRPGSVQISKNDEFGLTAMSALQVTGLSYEFSNRNDGMVVSIAGQSNEAMNGWCGKVNNNSFWDVPKEIPVAQRDKIIFWYSNNADFSGPNWDDLLSGNIASPVKPPTISKEIIRETSNSYGDELGKRITFTDVNEDLAWARDAIEILAGKGIIKGTEIGFEPQREITRAEFTQMMVQALGLKGDSSTKNNLSDVGADDWYAKAVAGAYQNELIQGYPDGSFKPGKPISRNEVSSIFRCMASSANLDAPGGRLDFQDAGSIPAWALGSIKYTVAKGLMEGYEDKTFRGENHLTRAEAAVILYRFLSLQKTF